jgi:hypothetical protein
MRKAPGFEAVNSLQDIVNMDDAKLDDFGSIMRNDAIEAGREIVTAAEEFKSIVTAEGYGEGSVAMDTAEEYVE